MAADWEVVALERLIEPERGISYGIVQPGDPVIDGVPIVRVSDIRDGSIATADPLRVSPDVEAKYSRTRLMGGELLLTLVGTVGEAAVVPESLAGWNTARAIAVIPVRKDIGAYWVKLALRAPSVQQIIKSRLNTTVQATLNLRDVAQLPIVLPPQAERRAITHILSTLDNKIELNRRMNETLEPMARALFNSWFVGFDLVRAKSNGLDQGLPASLAEFLPTRLIDSDLGKIPEGWKVGRLSDFLSELVSGARPKGGAADEGVPSIGAENVIGLGRYDFSKEKYVPRVFFEELRGRGAAVRYGDVLLYKDGAQIGRKTYFDCDFPHAECAINEHVFILRAKLPSAQRFLFFWLDQPWMTQAIISLNSNSAQPGINQSGVRRLPILIPPPQIISIFDGYVEKLTSRIFSNCKESRALAALRDTMLPRLISRELRVKDAEAFLARAV